MSAELIKILARTMVFVLNHMPPIVGQADDNTEWRLLLSYWQDALSNFTTQK